MLSNDKIIASVHTVEGVHQALLPKGLILKSSDAAMQDPVFMFFYHCIFKLFYSIYSTFAFNKFNLKKTLIIAIFGIAKVGIWLCV